MRTITVRDKIRGVATAWNDIYGSRTRVDEMTHIRERLAALDPETATVEQVEEIIGNRNWTRLDDCDDCGAKEAAVVEVGEEPDYESATARLCLACVHKAFNLCAAATAALEAGEPVSFHALTAEDAGIVIAALTDHADSFGEFTYARVEIDRLRERIELAVTAGQAVGDAS